MKALQFKVNIKRECCVIALIPYMADIKGIKYGDVVLDDPDKILKVEGDVSEQEIIDAVIRSGYKIKKIRQWKLLKKNQW